MWFINIRRNFIPKTADVNFINCCYNHFCSVVKVERGRVCVLEGEKKGTKLNSLHISGALPWHHWNGCLTDIQTMKKKGGKKKSVQPFSPVTDADKQPCMEQHTLNSGVSPVWRTVNVVVTTETCQVQRSRSVGQTDKNQVIHLCEGFSLQRLPTKTQNSH